VNEAKAKLEASGEAGVGKIFTSDLLTNLRTEEGRLQRLLGQLQSKYGKNHPLVIDADAELASNRKMIDDEVQRLVQELQNAADVTTVRVKNFEHEVALLQARIQSRNLAEIRRREMERDLLSEQKRYDTIALRLAGLDPQQEEIKATATVASYAEVPVSPTFPQPALLIGIGFAGSMILAIVAILVRDAMDDNLHTPEDIAGVLKVPNVISFPDYRKGRSSLANPYRSLLRDADSPFAMSMRSLYLAWRTIDSSAGGKVLMFVSTSPGEGKTMLSLSLATVAKSYGLKTVVVDLNPSSRGAAKLSGVPQYNSPVDLFVSGNAELEDVIVPSPSYPFLDFVISQRTPHESDQFFDALREHYDLIVVDAMSAEESDDAVWLSSHVDSVFVVVSADRTKRRRLTDLMQRLDISQSLLVGGIVNFLGKPKSRSFSRGKPLQTIMPPQKSTLPVT
jgi:Mrp family chromosome partitioning ATPase